MRVTDEYGNIRPFATGAVSLSIDGPAEIIGENPFALAGGGGAVWIRAKEGSGTVRLEAKHPYLKSKTVQIVVKPAAPEMSNPWLLRACSVVPRSRIHGRHS